ncbi:MAG: phosphatidate cytidylyltransferase [Thermonemataceae bacterium]
MKSPLSKLSNLGQRVIAGLIGAGMLVGAIYSGAWSFFLLFLLIALLSQWEFYTLLMKAGYKPMRLWGCLLGIGIVTGVVFGSEIVQNSDFLLLWYIVPCLAFLSFVGKLYDKDDKQPFLNLAFTFLGVLYVAFSWALFIQTAFVKQAPQAAGWLLNKSTYTYQVPLGIFFILWANDSGAYFVGKAFGKKKLFERVSPKKTWEGSIGGFVLATIVAAMLAIYFTHLASWKWYVLGVIITIAGTYGDLVESLLKRRTQVKDSGSVIPGHGGFLDRFDGLLLAAPFIALFLRLF